MVLSRTRISDSSGTIKEGNKIVCHTAKWLEVEVRRDGNIYFQRFESDDNGATPKEEVKVIGKYEGQSGTKITYLPDEKVYDGCSIDINKLRMMLVEMSYFVKGLHIFLIINNRPEEIYSQNGLIDGLSQTNRIGHPFQYFYETSDCKVELALQWVRKNGKIKGYANGLYMPDGGAFITGFKTSLTKVFNNLSNNSFSGEQIRSILDGFVSVKVKVGQFSNQAKTALANPEARTATATAITNAIKEMKQNYPKDFDTVVEMLNRIDKAERAAEKAKNAILNHEKKENEAHKKRILMPDKFKDCEQHGSSSTLIIVEGNSALGGMMPARDVKTEALYAIRGKIKNLLKAPLDECLENQEVSDIISILGCGIQNRYNSKKLNYGRVLISSDGDADGYSIMCLLSTMFFVLMPKFIEEGRLGWLRAPLFKLEKGDKRVFAYDAQELNELKKTCSNWTQHRLKGLGELQAADMEASMFHPTERRIEILKSQDMNKSNEIFELLMGEDVEPRREYLFNNADFDSVLK